MGDRGARSHLPDRHYHGGADVAVAASYGDVRSGELDVAYARLAREWRGKVIRLESNRRSGLSDFILVNERATFLTEVKGIPNESYSVPITAPQCEFLDSVAEAGGNARLLVLCAGEWWCGEPVFAINFHLQARRIFDMSPRRLFDVNDL